MISVYSLSNNNNKKLGSSDISQSNILNYKRRSKLVSYNSYNNKDIKTIDTLKNCYNALYDLKNVLVDHIKNVVEEKRNLSLTEQYYCTALINKTQTEIMSVYYIFIKKINLKDLKRDEKKLIKNIDNLTQVLYLLYEDLEKYKTK